MILKITLSTWQMSVCVLNALKDLDRVVLQDATTPFSREAYSEMAQVPAPFAPILELR